MNRKLLPAILIVTGLICVLGAITYAALTLQIPTQGDIDTVNSTLKANPSTIDWGTLTPNQQVTRQVTLTNTATQPTNPLSMTANPTIGTLTWNQQGNIIPAGGSLTATFTLIISPNPLAGSFSFDIIVTG
jgi:hypothetical protein